MIHINGLNRAGLIVAVGNRDLTSSIRPNALCQSVLSNKCASVAKFAKLGTNDDIKGAISIALLACIESGNADPPRVCQEVVGLVR